MLNQDCWKKNVSSRCVHSYTGVWKEGAIEEAAPRKTKPAKPNTLNKINKEVEKATLGDLAALTALKEQMESGEEKAPAPKAAAKPANGCLPKA